MICRLCLCDLNEFVPIFDKVSQIAEHELTKVIAKYFQLEVTISDPVSTNLCTQCWRYLSEFEKFCAMVVDKQQALHMKTEPPEPGIVVWNTESAMELKLALDVDVKDNILCEPEIDALHIYDHDNDHQKVGSNSDDGDVEDGDRFDIEYKLFDKTPVVPKLPRGRPRKGLRKVQVNAITKQKYEKPKGHTATVVAAVTTSSTLRESRARTRELRRNTSVALSPTAPAVVTPPKPSKKLVPARPKRGRPKGTRVPKPPKPETDEAELEAKRSTIKEMDAYIAANVRLDCCLCAAPLQDFTDLKRHFRAEHDCTGYMQCCNNRYKKRTLYVDHLHYHKDPDYFSCKPCRKRFLSRNSHVMHMLRFHSEQQELVHQCAVCEARFARKFLLTMHIKGHKGTERTEACETCDKSFRTKIELAAHIKRMHTGDITSVICDICGVNFRSKANFLIHKKALHPEGPVAEVQCHLCGRWLRDERSLRKHLAQHDDRDGNNKYRCKLCGAEKASRVALSNHMRYHHSNKRHSCTLCSKEFKLPRALQEHMATHTGIDLYSCPFCPRTFKSHANMHNHKKKMHPNNWVRKYTQPSLAGKSGETDDATAEIQEPVSQSIELIDVDETQHTSSSLAAEEPGDVMVYDIVNLSACAS